MGEVGGVEDHDEAALRALGIDPSDVANAEASRRAFVMESRREYGSGERVTMRRTWRMTMTIMLENNVSSHQANC